VYAQGIVEDMSPSRLRQFFVKDHDQYRVSTAVREPVLFALHNLLRDPPFSRLDLICCRNLLIYLDRAAQAHVLEMFRIALKPGGYLFLGTSESTDAVGNLFTAVDKKNRIYRVNPDLPAGRHMPLISDGAHARPRRQCRRPCARPSAAVPSARALPNCTSARSSSSRRPACSSMPSTRCCTCPTGWGASWSAAAASRRTTC
jgi:SAM-dependent methyltransferase